MVTIALLIAGPLVTIASMFICLRVAEWRLEKRFFRASAAIQAELIKLVEGKPCQSAAVLNALSRAFGSEAGRAAKASLMADLAHISREQNTAEADDKAAILGQQLPMLAPILHAGRGGRNKLFSNPLVQLALNALSGRAEHAPIAPTNGGSSVAERLKRGG